MTRFLFFAGKGGVGKTTCAAAAALGQSLCARTLVVSTDPAHSLADALEVRLSARPRAVFGKLFAAEMNADRALSRWLGARERAFRKIASRGTYLDDEDIDALFRLSLPGVDELVALIELTRLSAGFENVVVDTAPTGHTLRLLEMPQTLARLADVLDDLQAKHRALAASLRGSVRRDAEDAVIEELQRRARELHALVRSDAVEFHWVTLPEELALFEARDGILALRSAGMRVARLIANRITPAPDRRCTLCSSRRADEARVLRDARDLGLPIAVVPETEDEPRGLAALATLAALAEGELAAMLETDPTRPRVMRCVPERVPGHLTKRASGRRPPASDEKRSGRRVLGHLTKSARSAAVSTLKTGAEALGHLTKGGFSAAELAPEKTRLVFFGGKGGVGKTTAAAAAALELAGSGRRVLLLSTDPAHSLGDVLRAEIGDQERDVAPRLRARELDAKAAFRGRRERYRAAVDELFHTLRGGARFDAPYDRAVMQDLIELSPPGLDELFGLLAVVDALRRFDLVVVDTAPTGHALRLLELLAKAREWLQVLLQILLKYRRVTGLGHLAKDVTDTARELREFEVLVRDPAQARFVTVTRAAALPRLETVRLLSALRRLGISAPVVLVNALTPPGCSRCRRAAAAEGRQIAALRTARRGWVMLAAPATAPPPRGAGALRAFGSTWARIE